MGDIGKAVRKNQGGAILDIFVNADSDFNIFPTSYNSWRKRVEVKVKPPAKDSMANIEVIKTAAKFLDTPVKNVWIISGKRSKEKTIFIKGMSVNALIKKLEASLDGL
ncbi:MAG: YggU family protein [Thermoplasmatales archaeon]|nr:YggU family protein [Thermoplasmatales archaeon]